MKGKSSIKYWLIYVALLALVASNVHFATLAQRDRRAQVERIEERQAVYEEHAQQMQDIHATEYIVINGAREGYHADAYESGVERIAEQQLIAAEYQILLLQVIARQNAEMIELMLVP